MMRGWLGLLLGLAGCSSGQGGEQAAAAPPDLETAAIERGLVRDPAQSDATGLYARDGDRVCVVKRGSGYQFGAYAEFGDGLSCTGMGIATRSSDILSVQLRDRRGESCSFEAKFDGERIVFPANLPDGCAKLCGSRTSLAALDVERLSESAAEAAALRNPQGVQLCRD